MAAVDVPDRIVQLSVVSAFGLLPVEAVELLQIFVGGLGDHVEIQPLGRLRRLLHVVGEALGRAVAQPLLHGQAVALGLGDLLVVLVHEELVVEALRRLAAQDPADPVGDLHRVHQVLARHLVVHLERGPAHGPVGAPLHLDPAAGDRNLGQGPVLVREDDGPAVQMTLQRRRLQHPAGPGADRQEGRIGGAALLAEGRQHHRLDLLEPLQR